MQETLTSYSHRFGKKFRHQIYEKTNYHCYYCGANLTSENWSIDHIIPLRSGGSDDSENLIGACLPCNKRKKNHSIESFRVLQGRLDQGIPWFSRDQIEYLEKHGVTCHMPEYDSFWFERDK